jgi:hypothetical protein
MRTRRTLRKGGKHTRCGSPDQIIHAVSQLKRFAERAKEGKEFRVLQFGYNLGRLQEMMDCRKEKMNAVWWTPIEPLVEAKNWDALSAKIDELRLRTNLAYDTATVNKS